MAAYSNGGNNNKSSPITQYIDGLNMIPSATSATFDGDSTLFPASQFFDFDINRPLSTFPAGINAQNDDVAATAAAFDSLAGTMNPFTEFTHFGPGSHDALSAIGNSPFPSLPSSANISMKSSPANGIQGGHPSLQSRPTVPNYAHFEKHFGDMIATPQIGDKRNSTAASLPSVQDAEEETRLAAEEDKRRRNTAASARFRVKKKQREQALEKSAKDMSDKVHTLESRVNELEMENKWLKEMLIERNLAAATVASRNLEQHQKASEDTAAVARNAANTPSHGAESDTSEKVAEKVKPQHRKRGIGTAA